jgi:hypothetical protein
MKKTHLIFAITLLDILSLFSGLTYVKSVLNDLSDKGFPDDGANTSIAEAKQKGVLVCEATVTPMHTEWHGQSVDFNSAWIERKVKTKPYFVWWKKTENRPGYYLVICCKPENDILDGGSTWLVREGAGHGFASHGTNSFGDDVEDDDFNSGQYVIYICSDWHAPRINPIIVSWEP